MGGSGGSRIASLALAVVITAGAAAPAFAQDFQATHLEDRGRISVIELVGDYDRFTDAGPVNAEPRMAVAREFLRTHPDEYDFLIVFTTFPIDLGDPGVRGFHLAVRNDVQGIGRELFDQSALFGSSGRLQGYIDMSALGGYAADPLDPRFEGTLVAISHEILHQWAAYVRFRRPDGTLSDALLEDGDGPHWSFLLDSDASVLYGNEWTDNGDGTFTTAGGLKFFSPLDLYLAGFFAPGEVPPFVVVESPATDRRRLPERGVTVAGTPLTVEIQDVIAAEGPRVPAAGAARELRAAFLLVTRPGDTVAPREIENLERIRRSLQTRFSILTGGRGLLRIHPAGLPDVEPGEPEPVDPGTPGTGTVDLQRALDWLRGRQTPPAGADTRGWWEDRAGTRSRDTAAALAVLTAADSLFTPADRDRARAWLQSRAGANTDELARLAAALGDPAVGGAAAAATAATLRTSLRSRQNADGGWSLAPGYGSDPLDTALALLALAGTADTPAEALDRGAAWLLGRQGADGGWSHGAGGASRTGATTAALRALFRLGRHAPAADRALAWLAAKQSPADQGFGDSPSTAHDTASVLQTVLELGAADRIRTGPAMDFLRARQTAEGSWEGSVWTTALVASVLRGAAVANWRFDGAAEVVPAQPRDGERAAVRLRVRNDGSAAAPAGILRLFDGDPDAGGTPAAPDARIPALVPGATATVEILWDTFGKPGPRTLTAVLDPDHALAELSETDNRLAVPVEVRTAPVAPDLEVQPADVTFAPAQPSELPVQLGISVTVRNLGQTDAGQVRVRLLRGPPGPAEPVGEVTVALPGRSSTVANFLYTLETPGATTFTVVVDPGGEIAEDSEANNQASATVTTQANVDLAVTAADLRLDGPAFLGQDATFRATLRNRGTLDAPAAAAVRFAVRTADGTTIDLPGAGVLLGAGQSVEQTAVWRVDRTGDLTFLAILDPEGAIAEGDETNNTAELPFTASQSDAVDLAVRSEDLRFSPDPGLVGSPVTLSAVVRNTGGREATDVEVGFWVGDPAVGTQVGGLQTVPRIGPGESVTVSAVLGPLADASDRLIYVVVDPAGRITEPREDDNRAFQTLHVLSLPDLAVSASSLLVAPAVPRPGDAVTTTVRVANLGQREARDVAVRLMAGGTPLAADQVLAAVPAGGTVDAVFSWSFAGTVRIAAQVDPEGAIAEGSESNNSAERTVYALDDSQPVIPRYISPDGDGVQDSAVFRFEAGAAAGVAVEVADLQGRVVRRQAGVSQGAFEWDGRDDAGRLVRDGDYVLRAVSLQGVRLAEGPVTVDTNHSPLSQALGTRFERAAPLVCQSDGVRAVQMPLVEDQVFFLDFSFDATQPGVYSSGRDGAGLRRIGPSAIHLTVSDDGGRIGYSGATGFWGSKTVARADGSSPETIPSFSNDGFLSFGFRPGTRDFVYWLEDQNAIRLRTEAGADRKLSDAPSINHFEIRDLFAQEPGRDDFSPDGRRLVHQSPHETGLRLLDLETGALAGPLGGAAEHPVWSPDGSRLAFVREVPSSGDRDEAELVILDAAGTERRVFRLPNDSLAELPAYAGLGAPAADFVQLDELFRPSWSSSGEELAVGVRWIEESSSHFATFGRLLKANLVTGALETIAWLEPELSLFSFHIDTWNGSAWVERGVLHYGGQYAEQDVDLTPHLPGPDGQYRVRIRQTGKEAAHVDRVRLRVGPAGAERNLLPTGVAGPGADALDKLLRSDREVLDLHEKSMEVVWSAPQREAGEPVRLALLAREEVLSNRRMVPFSYPAGDGSIAYRIAEGSTGLAVDGRQTAADDLGEPALTEWSRPDTGHPAAAVVAWVKNDATHLYAALDFTVDNTEDGERDWAALQVETPEGWRDLRVTAADRSQGVVGFTRTGRVPWAHKYYEFKVSLAEIGARPGEVLRLRFQAYGTAALSAEATTFLPLYGNRPLWLPGEDTVLFTQDLSGSTWLLHLDDGNRVERVFDRFRTFELPSLSRSGRSLLFNANTDVPAPDARCYDASGAASTYALDSLANLTAELSGLPTADGRGIRLVGTATDLHFARYLLEYQDEAVPGFWVPLGPPVETPAYAEELTTWVPPHAGAFQVRLTVEDLAGNTRSSQRRFATGSGNAALTDLSVAPRLISPNGDGVQDTAALRYRVLQPVHLDIVVRNAQGDLVRSFRRDHDQIGSVQELVWDGRNASGLPVADGAYRIEVLSYAFQVVVDSTPPRVELTLHDARQARGTQPAVVAVAPAVSWCVEDANPPLGADLLAGEGAPPAAWRPFARVPVREACDPEVDRLSLELESFVGRSFRLEARDAAGNRAVAVTDFGAEELILHGFGPVSGSLADVPYAGVPAFAIAPEPFRFALTETVRAPLARLFVQSRRPRAVEPQDPWLEEEVTAFLTPDRFQVDWNLARLPLGQESEIRLRAVAVAGGEVMSNRVRVTPGGLVFRGRVDLDALAGDPALSDLTAALAAAGLDADEVPVLWAEEHLADPLTDVVLFLASQDDPRYFGGRPLPLAGASGRVFVFAGTDLAPCKSYEGLVTARTAPAQGAPGTVTSAPGSFRLSCLRLTAEVRRDEVACGGTPSSHVRITVQPESFDGAPLSLLTVAPLDPQDVAFSVNRPAAGEELSFDFDTAGLPEGVHPIYLRLSSGEGAEERRTLELVVDRSAPRVVLGSPSEGQRLCAVPGAGVAVEGTIEDLGAGVFYELSVLENGIFQPVGGGGRRSRQGFGPLVEEAVRGQLGTIEDLAGAISLRLEVEDLGGNRVCRDVSFSVDGTVEEVRITARSPLFSPNGDGTADQAVLNLSAAEPSRVTVEVFAGLAAGPSVIPTGPVLRRLADGVNLVGDGTLAWDGRRDDGTPASDGLYVAVARFVDGCGNAAERSARLEIDTRAPDVALQAPADGSTLTAVAVEIVGSVSDLHLLDWTVETGPGAAPLVWSLVQSGSDTRQGTLLALWNNLGLEGEQTLRLAARDQVGNRGQATVTVTLAPRGALIRSFEPTPGLFSPNGDGRLEESALRFALAAPARVTLRITHPDGSVVRTLIDNELLDEGAALRVWDGRDGSGQAAPDGAYRAVLRAVGSADASVTQEESVRLAVDRTPPTVELTRPRNGFAAPATGIVGSIQDASSIQYVISLADDPQAPVWREIARGTEPQLNATLAALDELEEGDYALRVEASDAAENRTQLLQTFTLDTTPPRPALTAPAPGGVFGAARGPVEVRGTVEEDHPHSWRLEVGSGSTPTAWSPVASGAGQPPATLAQWSVAGLPDGPATLRLTTEDEAGSTAEARIALTVDNTPPVAVLTAPAAGAFLTGPTAIRGTASDVTLLQYGLDIAPEGSTVFSAIGRGVTPVSDGLLLDWRTLPAAGPHRLRLTVEDRAGNTAQALVEVTIDREPPATPQGLTATVENVADVRLRWTAVADADLAGYYVSRGGVRLTAQPVAGTSYLDVAPAEGRHVYTVTAVDRAGLESAPSAPAEVLLDRTPPVALLHRPAAGSLVSGLVDVVATADAPDLEEYRVSVAPEGSPGAAQLLRQGAAPARAETVAQWSTTGLAEGSRHVLRLVVEDVRGNLATAEATVTVDNQPPAAPAGLAATVTGNRIDLTWTAGSAEAGVLFLLYRDGILVNATEPLSSDLRRYGLTATSYADAGRPDGTWTYTVAAIDLGGNVSAPSAPATATVEQRTPRTVLVAPEDGARIDRETFVIASTEDRDVSKVHFQVQAPGDTAWNDLGTPDLALPWETTWDPQGLPYGDYKLRAVARDSGGRVDAAPPAITVTHTDLVRPEPVASLTAQVDGGTVHLTWPASPASDLAGYHVERTDASGATVRLTGAPATATSFDDTGVPDGRSTWTVRVADIYGNESDPSPGAPGRVYTPDLDPVSSPTRTTSADLAGTVEPGAAVAVTVAAESGTRTLPPVTADAQGRFALPGVALERFENVFTVLATDGAGHRSKPAVLTVVSSPGPSAPTGLSAQVADPEVQLSWTPNPASERVAGYRLFRGGAPVLADEPVSGLSAESSSDASPYRAADRAVDGASYTYWSPAGTGNDLDGEWLAVRWAEPLLLTQVDLEWWWTDTLAVDFDLEVWTGTAWQRAVRVRGNGEYIHSVELPVPYRTDGLRLVVHTGAGSEVRLSELLPRHRPLIPAPPVSDFPGQGRHEYTVTAVDQYGFEGPPSASAQAGVGDLTPPGVLALTATLLADGTTAHLDWSESEAEDFLYYEIFRNGEAVKTVWDLTTTEWDDAGLPNGTHRYTVRAVDWNGNAGPLSNEVAVTVARPVPSAPLNLQVTVPDLGGTLDLTWQPGAGDPPAGYRVRRSTASGSGYAEVGGTADTSFRDTGLTDGTTYFYVVEALDGLGNASAPSNEASGTPRDERGPDAPVLHFPGFPGLPVTMPGTRADLIAGTAEPGSAVTLFRDGTAVASASARSETGSERLDNPDWDLPRLSPDGRVLWLESSWQEHRFYRFDAASWSTAAGATGTARWFSTGDRVLLAATDDDTGEGVLRAWSLADGSAEELGRFDAVDVAVPSPDGSRAAFVGSHGALEGLLLLDLASGALTQLDDTPTWAIDAETLAWSPDGARLVYRRRWPTQSLVVVRTAAPVPAQVLEPPPASYAPPSWAPTGAALFYGASDGAGWEQVRRYEAAAADAQTAADGDADGDGEVPVSTTAVTSAPQNHRAPQASPDGRSVAYMRDDTALVVESLATGATVELFAAPSWDWLSVLSWEKGGHLVLTDRSDVIRVAPAGRFEARNIALHLGDNAFTAQARDAAGNAGPDSLPMILTVPASGLPDLSVAVEDLAVLPSVPLVGQTATLGATVRNLGGAAAGASEMTLVLAKPDGTASTLADRVAVGPLAPGAAFDFTEDLALGAPGRYTLIAVADPLGRVAEAREEDNNRAERSFLVLTTAAPALSASTDRPAYGAGQDVLITLQVVNGGAAFSGRIEAVVEDASGFLVEALAPQETGELANGQTLTRQLVWNTGATFAGAYRVYARLAGGTGEALATAEAPFAIGDAFQLAATLASDRSTYTAGTSARLTGRVEYLAGNVQLAGAEARLRILDPAGAVRLEQTRPLGDLLPGGAGSVAVDWSTAGAAAGTHRAELEIRRAGSLLAAAETLFEVTAQPLALSGELAIADRGLAWGDLLSATFTLRNTGGTGASQLPVRVSVLDAATGRSLAVESLTVDLAAGASLQRSVSFDSTALGLGERLAVLQADLPESGGAPRTVTLDVLGFAVRDLTPPVLAIVRPAADGFVRDGQETAVSASDALSQIGKVEVSLDGGAWLPLELRDPGAGRFGRALSGLTEGAHTLRARAADIWGNSAETAPVAFTADLTPPQIVITGVQDGGVYTGQAVPVVEVAEAHPAFLVISLDGRPFLSGTPVTAPGTYELLAVAEDAAGNRTEARVTFVVEEEDGGTPVLSATKTDLLAQDADGDGLTEPGDTLQYTLAVRNTGTAPAAGATLSDPLPAQLSLVPGSVQTTQGTVASESPLQVDLGEIAVDGTATVVFQARIAADLPDTVTEVLNQASVSASGLAAVASDDPETPEPGDATRTPVFHESDGELPGLSVEDATVVEGTGASVETQIVVTLSKPAEQPVQVSYATEPDTAGEGTDFTPVADTLSFAPGVTRQTLKIPVLGDALHEKVESFRLQLSAPVGATLADGTGVVLIEDDDPLPSVSIADLTLDEGDEGVTLARLTLTLSAPSGTEAEVTWATADGTAAEGEDYQERSGTVSFPAGTLTAVRAVPIVGDRRDEDDETFFVRLANPVHVQIADGEAQVTIRDDEAETPRLTVADAEVAEEDEGETLVRLTVEVDPPASTAVHAEWATADGTAVAGQDYRSGSGTLDLAPGAARGTIEVIILGDRRLEADAETFTVELSAVEGADPVRPRATVSILDDELCASPNLLANPGAEKAAEGGVPVPGWTAAEGSVWRRKTANPPPAQGKAYFAAGPVDAAELWQDVDVSAWAGRIDAGAQSFELGVSVRTFDEQPPDTARVILELRDAANTVVLDAYDSGEIASPLEWRRLVDRRTAPAGTRWLRVRLLATRFNPGADGANDGYFDALLLRSLRAAALSVADATVVEGDAGSQDAPFAVTLSCPVDRDLQIGYATEDGTAVAGSDYRETRGTLTLPAGSASGTVPVPVLGDTANEPNETFRLGLTLEPGAEDVVPLDAAATGLIVNDDACPRSPGYWKTHPGAWPAQSLVLGGVRYPAPRLRDFLATKGSDASLHLARQLVATRFNLLAGSDPVIQPVADAADAFLARVPPGSDPRGADRRKAEALKDQLDAYNNSDCEEAPAVP